MLIFVKEISVDDSRYDCKIIYKPDYKLGGMVYEDQILGYSEMPVQAVNRMALSDAFEYLGYFKNGLGELVSVFGLV